MDHFERKHDAAPVEMAAGWIALCASCGWVGESYGSREDAAAASARHIAAASSERMDSLAFLDAVGHRPRQDPPRAA
jgi:ApbE superfamily uncharacterized protein (UPF0280 family)